MSVINVFDEKQNFWQVNPQFRMLGPFKSMYKNDRTRNHKKTSQIMWAIAFRLDPNDDNIYHNLTDEDKAYYLAKDFLGDENFEWEQYSDEMDFYKNMVLTQAKKSLVTWNEIMSLRDREIKKFYIEALDTKNIDLIVNLDKLLEKTPKFYNDYSKIKKDFDEENDKQKRGAGNKLLSLTDSNEI